MSSLSFLARFMRSIWPSTKLVSPLAPGTLRSQATSLAAGPGPALPRATGAEAPLAPAAGLAPAGAWAAATQRSPTRTWPRRARAAS